ncbi:uncharacterized protein Z519_03944 [Cladophialophora bantiana CBS 173.52]|uniref:Uncharacterized protein n=1 Tax=Cladophialophora bantiana (strain ATCC 10958 / CBS 173.52 / CDC B-1940 / NIH 8579) TaxID=1442370 RepID=A0A0D2HWP6_CLAB1|nr:uncharacterized protein Z519_03944 [Cladophialophora bantiana CBS 173.52]KIW95360.1 hypothetical protein Z519_03944 [Cladophialophora bantiana CBS 173.52]
MHGEMTSENLSRASNPPFCQAARIEYNQIAEEEATLAQARFQDVFGVLAELDGKLSTNQTMIAHMRIKHDNGMNGITEAVPKLNKLVQPVLQEARPSALDPGLVPVNRQSKVSGLQILQAGASALGILTGVVTFVEDYIVGFEATLGSHTSIRA